MFQAFSRRQIAAICTLAASGLWASARPASAFQGNMEHAIGSLENALQFLQQATPNKGCHRERAIQLVRDAIAQVQAGIDFAAEHGGGGL